MPFRLPTHVVSLGFPIPAMTAIPRDPGDPLARSARPPPILVLLKTKV
jgi:hypothetical protein